MYFPANVQSSSSWKRRELKLVVVEKGLYHENGPYLQDALLGVNGLASKRREHSSRLEEEEIASEEDDDPDD